MNVPTGTSATYRRNTWAEVEQAAAPKGTHVALREPFLRIDGQGTGWLEATDTYIAVRVPVVVAEGDTQGQVPTAALKAARKAGLHEVALNGSAVVESSAGRLEVPRDADTAEMFPDIAQLVRDPSDDEIVLRFQPALLARAAKAIGAEAVEVRVLLAEDGQPNLKPMVVRPVEGGDGRVALVMPYNYRG